MAPPRCDRRRPVGRSGGSPREVFEDVWCAEAGDADCAAGAEAIVARSCSWCSMRALGPRAASTSPARGRARIRPWPVLLMSTGPEPGLPVLRAFAAPTDSRSDRALLERTEPLSAL